jgi:long-chain acyl-CoA synthetase
LSRFIDEACVVGDRRTFVAALVVPDFAALEAWARAQGLGASDRAALAAHPAVCELIMGEIRDRQKSYAPYEQVRRCIVLAEPFSLERGEVTPSLKVRRKVVEEHFLERIEQLYAAEPADAMPRRSAARST